MSIITCRSHLSRGVPNLLRTRTAETLFNYVGGSAGEWKITKVVTHSGTILRPATHLQIVKGDLDRTPSTAAWVLKGFVNNTRYVAREESRNTKDHGETCAALVLVMKSATWWNLAQDERREILDSRLLQFSRGLRFLPALARRIKNRGRDLGESFDFVTWFEYAPHDAPVFDDLVAALRVSEEWQYVEREIEIRLVREPAN